MADMADQTAPFQQLDFLYTPSRDVATDLVYFTDVLGGRVVFAIEAMGHQGRGRPGHPGFPAGPPGRSRRG